MSVPRAASVPGAASRWPIGGHRLCVRCSRDGSQCCCCEKINSFRPARYISIDIDRHFRPSVLGSITSLPLLTGSIDYLVCYHTLEHVPDDGAAIRELARVMAPHATAFIQVPRRKGSPTDEDAEAPAAERIERFGQADHVRYYGDDFERRLYEHGMIPAVLTPRNVLTSDQIGYFALQPDEEVWICRLRTTSIDSWRSAYDLRERRDRSRQELDRYRSNRTLQMAVRATRPLRQVVRRLRHPRDPAGGEGV